MTEQEVLYAITLHQPWATAIMHLGKDVENRNWVPWERLLGKRFAVHAGARLDKEAAIGLNNYHGGFDFSEVPHQAFLGTAELVGYVRMEGIYPRALFESDELERCRLTPLQVSDAVSSTWHIHGSKVLWVLRDPRPLAKPIPYRGSQGWWRVPPAIAARMAS